MENNSQFDEELEATNFEDAMAIQAFITALDFSGQGMTELPDIKQFTNLKSLDLTFNKLKSFPNADLLKDLQIFKIGGLMQFGIQTPDFVKDMKHLIWLEFVNSRFYEMPKLNCKLKILRLMLMGNLKYNDVCLQLKDMKSLTHLDLAMSLLWQKVPEELALLENLEYLNLMSNRIKSHVDLKPVFELKKLKTLHIAANPLDEIELGIIRAKLPQGCKIIHEQLI